MSVEARELEGRIVRGKASMEQMKLGDTVSFTTGKLNSNAAKPDGEFPFFTCSQETFKTDTYSFDTECVLLGGNNANGIYPLKFYSGKFDAYQRTYVIRTLDNKKLINKYLFYALRPKLEILKSISTGAATKFLTLTILRDLQIELPSIGSQQKIASILSVYDDFIENNNRRIKILEEMAQAIYREWFVNFRFPGHKKIKMVKSKLGMIPEGWEITSLSDHITIDKGISYKGDYLTDVGLPMVNLKCIQHGGGFRREGTKPYSGDYRSHHEVTGGDIVFANTDLTQAGYIIGSVAMVPRKGFENGGIASHHICIVRKLDTSPIRKMFLYHILLADTFKDFAKGIASGTTVLGLRSVDAQKYSFIQPSIKLLAEFEDIAQPLYNMVERLLDKNDTLRKTRDLLLPKLISGEIDVEKTDIKILKENSNA